MLAIDFHGGKARRQRAAGKDVLRPDLDLRIVKVYKISRPDVYGSDAEANFLRIDAIEIHMPFQCGFERVRIVVAGRCAAKPPVGRLSRREEVCLAQKQGIHRANLLCKFEGRICDIEELGSRYDPSRGSRNGAPELAQFFDPRFR
jgi:hypothetical protein